MEIVAGVFITLLLTVLLVVFTPIVWWACFLLALVVTVLGVWLGPELF